MQYTCNMVRFGWFMVDSRSFKVIETGTECEIDIALVNNSKARDLSFIMSLYDTGWSRADNGRTDGRMAHSVTDRPMRSAQLCYAARIKIL